MRSSILNSIPGLYSQMPAALSPTPLDVTTKKVSRHVRTSSGGQNHPWLRTTAFE